MRFGSQHHFAADRVTFAGAAAEVFDRLAHVLPALRAETAAVPGFAVFEDRVAARDVDLDEHARRFAQHPPRILYPPGARFGPRHLGDTPAPMRDPLGHRIGGTATRRDRSF